MQCVVLWQEIYFLSAHLRSRHWLCTGDGELLTMHWTPATLFLTGLSAVAFACESCEHPERDVVLTRNVRRMQPDAVNTTSQPRAPLAWGQLNFMHTTDTHGWLVRFFSCSFSKYFGLTCLLTGGSPERTKLWRRLGRLCIIREGYACESQGI